mmetsp:Transcript_31230/g.68317  ORF Transcript_31230/g.68317 Transcript_31230/m.68317 type:complete len:106 (-) Transcript_31230:630-947(-)
MSKQRATAFDASDGAHAAATGAAFAAAFSLPAGVAPRTMLRPASTLPACDASPEEPIVIRVMASEQPAGKSVRTMFLLPSNMPDCVAPPWLPFPMNVGAAADWRS